MELIRSKCRSIYLYALKVICEDSSGLCIVKDQWAVAGYCFLYLILLILLLTDPFHLKASLTYSGFSSAVIGVTTGLIALLIPIAISLIDDSKVSFMRPVIVKHIVRLQWLTLITFFLFSYSLLPNNGAFKEMLTPLVIVGWTVFLFSFIKSYLWLNDGTPPDLKMSKDKGDDDPPRWGGKSYKFSRTIKYLFATDDERPWETIWEQKQLPVDFEDQLHIKFLAKVKTELGKPTAKAQNLASLLMAVYAAGFKNRNTANWRFYGVYLDEFLDIYAKITNLIEKRNNGGQYLWQGKDASEKILDQLFNNGFGSGQDYELFMALKKYCEGRGLDKTLSDQGKFENDIIVTNFLLSYFNALYEDKLFPGDMYFKEYGKWDVTFSNLYEKRINLSFIVAETYKAWLWAKLKDSPDDLYKTDRITSIVFSDSDPITISHLLWLLKKGENTDDLEYVLRQYMNDRPPIGYMTHPSAMWESDKESDEQHQKEYLEKITRERRNAVKLFVTMYQVYFGMWHIKDLDKAVKKIRKDSLDDRQKAALDEIYEVLKQVNEYIATVTRKQG